MGTNTSGLLSCQRHGAEDGNQDQDGCDFKGKKQIAEEDTAEIGGCDQGAAAQLRIAQRHANGEEDVGEQAKQCSDAWKTDEISGLTAAGALLFAGIQQHDDEG